MSLPFISCKCITYARTEFLEESIESFLKQEYDGKKELIIVNDYPLQKLKFDHPDVKIFNMDTTFSTIGEKENFAVSQCSGDIIALWDDDDIMLHNHLSNIAKYFTEGVNFLQWNRGVFMNMPKIVDITGIGNAGVAYSKNAWEKVNGHNLENAGYDMSFLFKIRDQLGGCVAASPPDNEVSFFYIWGGRAYHMSGLGTDTPDRPNVIQRHTEYIEQQRLLGYIPIGDIELVPNWKYDYKQMLIDFIKDKR
jgi:glycosyltransferase involved in cell wall biosynthesis